MRPCIEIPYGMFGISLWWTVTGEQPILAPQVKCLLQPQWITSPLASHPCQVAPSFTFPTGNQCTTMCHKGLKSWYYDTMQGRVKERKRNAWLLLTLGRCLGFVQAPQHIWNWDDLLIITRSASPMSFYAYRKHAMKRLLSAKHICYLLEKKKKSFLSS